MGETKKPLQVLHIFSGDLWAGAEVMIYNLLNRLKQDPGIDVLAISLNHGALTVRLRSIGVEVYVVPEVIFSFPKIFFLALRFLRKKNVHLIHSHRYKENLLALILAKKLGIIPLVSTVHGLPEAPLERTNGHRPTRFTHRMNFFFLRRYFSKVVAVSGEIQKTLTERFNFPREKTEMIHNGVPVFKTHKPDHSLKNGKFHIGTVARLVPVKNLNLFLETASVVKNHSKQVGFSILGGGPLKEKLMEKTRDLHLEDSVEFLNPRTDTQSYYRSLDLYLNTSLHEGIPLSVLEAMRNGIPVIAPKVGGLVEIIRHGDNGLLLKEYKSKEYARACLQLMEDPDLRQILGANALKRVATRFSDHEMARSYRRLYWKLCTRY